MTPPLSPKKKERSRRSEPSAEIVAAVRTLKRKVEENLDQLALVHGVLEELCERQEALASWQMEYAKRTLSLGEAQWHALNAFSRRPGARAKTAVPPRPKGNGVHEPDEGFDDLLDDATAFLTELSGDLLRRKDVRRRVMEERAADRAEDAEANENDDPPTAAFGEAEGSPRSKAGKSASGGRKGKAKEKGTPKRASAVSKRSEDVEPLESILVLPEKTEFH